MCVEQAILVHLNIENHLPEELAGHWFYIIGPSFDIGLLIPQLSLQHFWRQFSVVELPMDMNFGIILENQIDSKSKRNQHFVYSMLFKIPVITFGSGPQVCGTSYE